MLEHNMAAESMRMDLYAELKHVQGITVKKSEASQALRVASLSTIQPSLPCARRISRKMAGIKLYIGARTQDSTRRGRAVAL